MRYRRRHHEVCLTNPARRPPELRAPLPEELIRHRPATQFSVDQDRFFEVCSEGAAGSGMTTDHLEVVLSRVRASEMLWQMAEEFVRAEVLVEVVEGIRLGRMTALRKPIGGVRADFLKAAIFRLQQLARNGLWMSDSMLQSGGTLSEGTSRAFTSGSSPLQVPMWSICWHPVHLFTSGGRVALGTSDLPGSAPSLSLVPPSLSLCSLLPVQATTGQFVGGQGVLGTSRVPVGECSSSHPERQGGGSQATSAWLISISFRPGGSMARNSLSTQLWCFLSGDGSARRQCADKHDARRKTPTLSWPAHVVAKRVWWCWVAK